MGGLYLCSVVLQDGWPRVACVQYGGPGWFVFSFIAGWLPGWLVLVVLRPGFNNTRSLKNFCILVFYTRNMKCFELQLCCV